MSRTIRRKCVRDYLHYYVREDVTWDDPDPDDDSQMREIALVCFRCGHCLWIDSIVRPWMGFRSDDDWGT